MKIYVRNTINRSCAKIVFPSVSEGEREGLILECAGESPLKPGGILIDRLTGDDN